MGQRETHRDGSAGDLDVTVDPVEDESARRGSPADGTGSRVRARLARLFSVRAFLAATVASLAGFLVVGGLLPLGGIANLLGIAVGAFAVGTATGESRYVESALGGAVVGGGAAVLDDLVLTILTLGLPLVALGALGGLVAGVVGHYFGRDLRHGLTRDL